MSGRSTPPRVSVIIPAFNAADTIEAAVGSVLAQEGIEVEALVVDDASSDGTAARVEGLSRRDGRVRLIVQGRNGGPGAARNRALAEARGAWVALLDADDLFLPGRLAALVGGAQAAAADMAADDMLLLSPDGAAAGGTAFGLKGEDAIGPVGPAAFVRANRLLGGGYTLGYAKPIFRTDLIRRNGLAFRTDLSVAEDFHFYLDALLARARFVLIPRALYGYRLRPGSLSRSLRLADLHAMRAASTETMARARALGRGEVLNALKERHATIEMAITHLDLVSALKSRRFGLALRRTGACPAVLPHLARSGAEGLMKRARRLLAR